MPDRLRFLNPSAAPVKPASQWAAFVEIWTKTRGLLAALVMVILGCAALYYLGCQSDWGIQPTFDEAPKAGILDCLHFSVVTVTTLGYGDYRPQSYGRLVAGSEAVLGLILMGVFVSRLVSRQQDHLTKRLVSGQLNSEIQEHREKLALLLQSFRHHPPRLTSASPSAVLHDAGALAKSIGSYWRHEATHADLTKVLPVRAASRLVGDLLTVMGAISFSLAGKLRADVNPHDVIAINRVAESSLTIVTVLADRVMDQSTAHLYERVATLAKQFRGQLNQMPKAKKSTARSRRRDRRQQQGN